ncbi:MAG: metallophosphoesterase [Actinobacteria bacterium]|nr:metallophosphoesterase [Actinomycetota bacterium]
MVDTDEVVIEPELTTVGPDFAVIHDGEVVRRYDGLRPDTYHDIDGFTFQTLPAPGELLARFATVNDVHFGEVAAGIIEGSDIGPVLRSEPGAEPYPELMNRCAVAEIDAIGPDAVIAKGDLTSKGTVEEYERFLAVYGTAFGDRLHHVRGNHDACHGGRFAAFPHQRIDLPGVTIALIDTAVEEAANGRVDHEVLEWLDAVAADADRPVLVMGHHHCWSPDRDIRDQSYFGINPADSIELVDVVRRRPVIHGYFAGHTHRNRRQAFSATGSVPWVEVASVKEFPGTWAEYRVYDGGICQIHHRISDPAALAWTNRTRAMYVGLYTGYAFGKLEDRCFAIPERT